MKNNYMIILAAVILLMAGCGPSTGEIATMTAAAWTPTPLPTATPTPIPFDITVNIADQDGNSIPNASLVFPESGDNNPVNTDDNGQATWNNLPGDSGTLSVSAQGYLPAEQSLSLERGPNEVTITLERDPYGLSPTDACASGEFLAYAEDFQDGVADGWPDIQFNTPGWTLGPDPSETSDLVISAHHSDMSGEGPIASQLQELDFDNAVWRIRYMVDGKLLGNNGFSFNWLHALQPFEMHGTEVFDSRYQLPMAEGNFEMRRVQLPVLNLSVARGSYPKSGEWHMVEMATYQGYTEVWVDGMQVMTYQDPEPLPAGGISLEVWLMDEAATVYFDDISLCELSSPFVPIPTPEPAE